MKSSFGFRLAPVMIALAAFAWLIVPTQLTRAVASNCSFTTAGTTMTLDASCTTDTPIIIPDGFTLDGAGHVITGVDPAGGHFKGGVIQSGGNTAYVNNVQVTVSGLSNICDAGADRLRGVLFDGASGSITNSTFTGINQGLSGCQEGNAIEVRNFASATTVTINIDSNTVVGAQKTGIICNGNSDCTITDNTVTGNGAINYIAENGIQIGFGAHAFVKGNVVTGHSYTGTSTVSGGILVVGGPGYGGDYCKNVQILKNTLRDNDVGVFLSQIETDGSAPPAATNIKVVNNTVSNAAKTNGFTYQAGVSDVGNNDKIITNTITGAGYDPTNPCGCLYRVDADASFTNRPKVHANS
jgi:parallel beta-helix repeat protein